ncbi:MAG: PH domain-containing protein [Actinomycetota bacterium]|nr:PH domain-containing protein [Actinomycetota bacterium]
MSGTAERGFARVHPLSPLLRGGLVLVALAITAGRRLIDGEQSGWPWWLAPAVFAVTFAGAAVSWWFTRYRVGDDELRIDSGVLHRRSRRVRLDRIQAIEVQQPLLARIFGMASLAIETAGGGSDSEVTLAYLSLRRATDLRAHLLVEAGREGGVDPVQSEAAGLAASGSDGVPVGGIQARENTANEELLHRVSPGLLLAAQILRTGPLLSALVVSATAIAAAAASAVGLPQPLRMPGAPATGGAVSVALVLPVLLAVVTSIGKGFVDGYGFSVRRSPRGLAVRAGLLGVRSASLPVQRVRGLVVTEPIVWRRLGWVALDVTVAGVVAHSEQDQRLSTTLVPVARRAAAERLVAQVLPGVRLDEAPLSAPPVAARWVDPLARRRLGLGGNSGHVITRRGLLTRRTDIVPLAAVQSRGLRQGPVQRWLGLATVGLHLPAGPTRPVAEHRSVAEAWQLMLTPVHSPARADDPAELPQATGGSHLGAPTGAHQLIEPT